MGLWGRRQLCQEAAKRAGSAAMPAAQHLGPSTASQAAVSSSVPRNAPPPPLLFFLSSSSSPPPPSSFPLPPSLHPLLLLFLLPSSYPIFSPSPPLLPLHLLSFPPRQGADDKPPPSSGTFCTGSYWDESNPKSHGRLTGTLLFPLRWLKGSEVASEAPRSWG